MMKEFREKSCDSFSVKIWLAGDIQAVKLFFSQYLADVGLCVTVSPTLFSYTGGEEDGLVIGLVNYPRFPSTPDKIIATAKDVGEKVARHLGQGSYLIETPSEMIWFTRREGD